MTGNQADSGAQQPTSIRLSRESLSLSAGLTRRHDTITDLVVLGLVTGALGRGLLILSRQRGSIRFDSVAGADFPVRGLIEVVPSDDGTTSITCNLELARLRRTVLRRTLAWFVLLALVVVPHLLLAGTSVLGWLVATVLAVGLGASAIAVRHQQVRRRLVSQLRAFISNTDYLKM